MSLLCPIGFFRPFRRVLHLAQHVLALPLVGVIASLAAKRLALFPRDSGGKHV